MLSALPPYLCRLIYITAGFILIVGGLILAGEMANGWNGLTYIIFAMGATALWAAICVVYAIWVLIRDGWGKATFPAACLIALIVGFGAFLFLGRY